MMLKVTNTSHYPKLKKKKKKNFFPSLQTNQIGADMAHQLYVLQQLLLNQYEERMNTSMEPSDQDATDKIKELRRIAFESDGEVSF